MSSYKYTLKFTLDEVKVLFVMIEKSWSFGTWNRLIPKATLNGVLEGEKEMGIENVAAGQLELTRCGPV